MNWVKADAVPVVEPLASCQSMPVPEWSPGSCTVEEQRERAAQDGDIVAGDRNGMVAGLLFVSAILVGILSYLGG